MFSFSFSIRLSHSFTHQREGDKFDEIFIFAFELTSLYLSSDFHLNDNDIDSIQTQALLFRSPRSSGSDCEFVSVPCVKLARIVFISSVCECVH